MNVQPYIDRLRATLTGMRLVGGAADFDAALRGVLSTPSAFVIPLVERPIDDAENDYCGVGGTRNYFGVILVVENHRDATGEASLVELEPIRRQVKAALRGWLPDSHGEPIKFVLGELVQAKGDAQLWWSDEFVDKRYRPLP